MVASEGPWLWIVVGALLVSALAFGLIAETRAANLRRLTRLAEAARRLSEGDAELGTALVDSRNDAIGELTEAFRKMAASVAEREAALRGADRRAWILIDSVASAIVTFDSGGHIESMNRAATKLLGYATQELCGHGLSLLLPEFGELPGRRDAMQTGKADGEFGSAVETNARRSDGVLVPVHLSIAAIRFEGRRFFIAVMTDLTDIRKAEQARDSFVSIVSHELRTPLSAIQGALALVRAEITGELPEKTRSMIAIAHANTERLLRIVNDILDMEKIKAGKIAYDFRAVDLPSLLEQAVEANRIHGAQFDVNIVLAPVPHVCVRADIGRLTQALTNLLSNAIKVSDDGGCVVVDAKVGSQTVRISITDQGPGIAPELQSRIFEDFVQGERSGGRKRSGYGLGLGIARTIVRDHGGTLDFVSQAGRGTSFFLDLPLADAAGDACDSSSATAPGG
jgi:PAS domain S-box-containing protein